MRADILAVLCEVERLLTAGEGDEAAAVIRRACQEKGFPFLCDSPTNQQFPILPDEALPKLAENYAFANFGKTDEGHTAVRFCASWATPLEDAQALAKDLLAL